MDKEQLYQNLNELEKQLKGIKAATEHVNQVVASDRELVIAVNAFTAEAHKVLETSKGICDEDVKNIAKEAKTSLDNSAADFSEKVKAITTELTSNVSMLKTTVDEDIKPMVGETVETIEHTLKPFVKDEMPKTFNDFMDKYEALFKKASDDISEASKTFAEQVETQVAELRQVAIAIQGPQEQTRALLSDIRYDITSLKESLDSELEISTESKGTILNVSQKIDDTSQKISSSADEIKQSIVSISQGIANDVKISGEQTCNAIIERMDPLSVLPERLDSLASSVDSSFKAVNSELASVKDASEKSFSGISQRVEELDKNIEEGFHSVTKPLEDISSSLAKVNDNVGAMSNKTAQVYNTLTTNNIKQLDAIGSTQSNLALEIKAVMDRVYKTHVLTIMMFVINIFLLIFVLILVCK